MQIRVELGREQLRDYFLRLGATAAIDETGAVGVRLADDDDETVEEYLRSWTTVNGIAATIERQPAAETSGLLFGNLQIRPRLGQVLVARHLISEEHLEEGLREATRSGDMLGRVLLRRRWLFEDELARALSEQLQIPYVNIASSGFDRSVARMLPAEVGLRYAAIPVRMVDGRVRVAFADPCDDAACAAIGKYCGDYEVAVTELSAIELAWRDLGRHS